MEKDDDARWALPGEGIVAFLPRRLSHVASLPKGLHPVAGPIVVIAERFTDSPVGPFLSLSIGEPVRMGLRLGYFFGLAAVSSNEARRVGRQYWGFPYEVGKLHWMSEAGKCSIEWEERGFKITGKTSGMSFPFLIPIRTLQRRSDGLVIVPTRMRAFVRPSRVQIEISTAAGPEANAGLESFAGIHKGLVLSGMLLRRAPARRSLGPLSTFRAPLRASEPGVAGMTSSR